MTSSGSIQRGPSEAYLLMLKGELSSKEYVAALKKGDLPQSSPGASGRSGSTASEAVARSR